MKLLLAITSLFISINAFAEVVDLGSFEGRRDSNGYSARDIWISDVNQSDQRINNFSDIYTFELKAPARLSIQYNSAAVDVTEFKNGTLIDRQSKLEKQSHDGTWKTIVSNSREYGNASSQMWNLFDIRKADGTFFPTNPNQTDTLGKYRLSLAAQAAQGQYLSSFASINAYWTLNQNAPMIAAPVPEPETYALMGVGLLGLMATRRRKMK